MSPEREKKVRRAQGTIEKCRGRRTEAVRIDMMGNYWFMVIGLSRAVGEFPVGDGVSGVESVTKENGGESSVICPTTN